MDDLIAERTFDLKQSDGGAAHVKVGVDRPIRSETGQDWICHIYVERPGKTTARSAHGESSLQALLTAVKFLRLEVAELQAHYGSDISFDGQHDLWFGLAK